MADVFGLFPGQLAVQIHSGSRGLGHQVCTDYVRNLQKAETRYGIKLPDRELVCAPLDSPEGRDYFAAMAGAANYAWANRQCLAYLTRRTFEEVLAGNLEFEQEPRNEVVTILFTDLCGFTKMSGDIRAKKMSKILNSYLNEMIEIISWHEGTIDKFIGDAIMVFWGAPVKLDPGEQIKKATACAREMQKALEPLN